MDRISMGVFWKILVITCLYSNQNLSILRKKIYHHGIPDINIPADSASITRV